VKRCLLAGLAAGDASTICICICGDTARAEADAGRCSNVAAPVVSERRYDGRVESEGATSGVLLATLSASCALLSSPSLFTVEAAAAAAAAAARLCNPVRGDACCADRVGLSSKPSFLLHERCGLPEDPEPGAGAATGAAALRDDAVEEECLPESAAPVLLLAPPPMRNTVRVSDPLRVDSATELPEPEPALDNVAVGAGEWSTCCLSAADWACCSSKLRRCVCDCTPGDCK